MSMNISYVGDLLKITAPLAFHSFLRASAEVIARYFSSENSPTINPHQKILIIDQSSSRVRNSVWIDP